MKKLLLLIIAPFLFASTLPKNFGECVSIRYFNQKNSPLPFNDFMKNVTKYECNNQIIYIGIEERIPGILKLNTNSNTKDFLLTHTYIQNLKTAIYIDKQLKKGVIAVQLNKKYALKVLFYSTDYKSILKIISKLNFKKIIKSLD